MLQVLLQLLKQYLPQLIALLKQQAPKAIEAPPIPQIKPEKVSFKLTRKEYRSDGIFSELHDDKGNLVAQILEHAYLQHDSSYAPKVPLGNYKCVRGPHRLHNMTEDFITFEVTGVPNCVGILYHWGNWESASEGCLLMGATIAQSPQGQMITSSRDTWGKFMASLDGINEFELTVC
jgi:hypothetical protein